MSSVSRVLVFLTLFGPCAAAQTAAERLEEPPVAPVLDGLIQDLVEGSEPEAGWARAVILDGLSPDRKSQLMMLVTTHAGSLYVGFHSELAYQESHSLKLLLIPVEDPGRGTLLALDPFRGLGAPSQEFRLTMEEGAALFEKRETPEGVLAVGAMAQSGQWSAEILLASPVLEGQREFLIGLQMSTEFGPVSLPTGADLESRKGLHRLSVERGLTSVPPDPEAMLREVERNRQLAEAEETIQKLNIIRDRHGMVRIASKISRLNPGSIAARLRESEMLSAAGGLQRSIEIVKDLSAQYPFYHGLPAPEIMAHRLLSAGRWDEAREALLALPESNLRRRIDLGMIEYHLGNFELALQRLDALLVAPDVPFEKKRQIQPFRDYAKRYLEVCLADEAAAEERDAAGEPLPRAVFHLPQGKVIVELLENDAPATVANFISLAGREGFYQGTQFHAAQSNVLVQGGCPLTKNDSERDDGMGNPGYRIRTEKPTRHHFRGRLVMAGADLEDQAGSQFYFTLATAAQLDGKQVVFGRVLEGMEIIDRLEIGDRLISIEIQRKRSHAYDFERLPLEEQGER